MNETDGTDRMSLLSREEIEDMEQDVAFFETRQGTRLAFHEYGAPGGRPIIFYHGTGSHLHGMLLHKPGLEYGFRIIAPDRPGVAQSEFRPGWTLLEYAQDMADLADHLGIDSFGVIGISGGGPTLMASARAIPDRLQCVVDLACAMPVYADPDMVKELGTMDHIYAFLGTHLPHPFFQVPFSLIGMTQKVMKSPETFTKMFDSSLCPEDKALFGRPDFQYLFMRDFQELYRHGSKGPAYDAQTVYLDWGFDLSDIDVPIEVFHGSADRFVPVKFSEYLVNHARDVRLHLVEGQGHFYHVAYGYQLLEKVAGLEPYRTGPADG